MSWHGKLMLRLAKKGSQTMLVSQRHFGPLFIVQKPFYPEGKITCHLYLLTCLHVNLCARSRLLLTTPAAAKYYRSLGN